MRQFAFLALLVGGLAGCVATSPYGNFATNSPPGLNKKIAADTVKRLLVLYPPASTRFDLGQPTPDDYGAALVESLRSNGYAVMEFLPTPTKASNQEPALVPASGLRLRYVLDAPVSTNLYRVTVMVGSQSLTRAYSAQNNGVTPASAWVRKE